MPNLTNRVAEAREAVEAIAKGGPLVGPLDLNLDRYEAAIRADERAQVIGECREAVRGGGKIECTDQHNAHLSDGYCAICAGYALGMIDAEDALAALSRLTTPGEPTP